MSSFGTGLMQGLGSAMQTNRIKAEKQQQLDFQEQQIKLQKQQMKLNEEMQRAAAERAMRQLEMDQARLAIAQDASGLGWAQLAENMKNRAAEQERQQKFWDMAMSAMGMGQQAGQPSQDVPGFLPRAYREFLQKQGQAGITQGHAGMTPYNVRMTAQGPSVEFRKSEIDRVVPASEYANFRGPDGELPQIGMTYRQLQEKGYRPINPPQYRERQVQLPTGEIVNEVYDVANRGGNVVSQTMKPAELSPDEAGKIANVSGGMAALTQMREMLSSRTPEQVRGMLFSARVGMPFSEGRQFASLSKTAADAIIRARTGAAMTEDEWASIQEELIPNYADSVKTIQSKMERMDRFLSGQWEGLRLPPSLMSKSGGGEMADDEYQALKRQILGR